MAILLQRSNAPAVNRGSSIFVYVEDPDSLHAEFANEGIGQLSDVSDAFYGCREFEVTDPDRHHITFAKDMNQPPYGVGLGPDRGNG